MSAPFDMRIGCRTRLSDGWASDVVGHETCLIARSYEEREASGRMLQANGPLSRLSDVTV